MVESIKEINEFNNKVKKNEDKIDEIKEGNLEIKIGEKPEEIKEEKPIEIKEEKSLI